MPKRIHEEEHENTERWLVSYADFITLLFAFFTVMYAISQKDVEKAKEFEESVKKAFSAVVKFGSTDGPGDFPKMGPDTSPIPPPIQVFRRNNAGPAELTDAVERAVQDNLKHEEQEKLGLEIREDALGVRIAMSSTALFDSGSAYLRPDMLLALDKVAVIVNQTARRVFVEGHTDSQNIKSNNFPTNWELGAARASIIVRYLIRKHEIPSSRLVAMTYADQRPVADNSTEEGRRKNRRIEILVTAQDPNL